MPAYRFIPSAGTMPLARLLMAFVSALLVPLLLALLFVPSSAMAAGSVAPALQVTNMPVPTVLPLPSTGRSGEFQVAVENIGGEATSEPVTVTDEVPAGLSVSQVIAEPEEETECEPSANKIVCTFGEAVVPAGFLFVDVQFHVTGSPGAGSELANKVSVSGGGASSVASSEPAMKVAEHEHERAGVGVSEFTQEATGPAGEPSTQAGGHPTFLTTRLLLNNVFDEELERKLQPVQAPKDLSFYLPLGMLGDPAITEPCPGSLIQLQGERSGCPTSSRVGTILPVVIGGMAADAKDPTHEHGIYSITPEKGFAAEFAFGSNGLTFYVYASVVRHDGAYLLRVEVPGVPAFTSLVGLISTFYGDITEANDVANKELTDDRGAFLTNPMNCADEPRARTAGFEMTTWDEPEPLAPTSAVVYPVLEGCSLLQFGANLTAAPETRTSGDSTEADEPSGYKLDLEVPQAPDGGSGLGTPPYEDVDFTFPEGTSLSPGAANGLTSCPATGPQGINIEGPESERELEADGLVQPVAGHCPASSQVGNVSAISPDLPNNHQELKGHLFLAEPECGNSAHPNACTPEDAANGSLYRLYLELEEPQDGVVIKLPGKARVNPNTGQVESVFEDTPQFPVSDLTIETSGGPRASLANPQTCGTATTTGLITPWDGGAPSEPSGSFQVNEGCGAQGFSPSFTAGTSDPQAGAYSPFTLTLKREDREQDISAISTTLPPGLLAAVSHVSQCPEPQADQGGCPESSHVGTATVGIGSGTDPYYQTGQVYFTGPYGGGPFGLSVVVPAVAGPFNLGNVIVRVALSVNPTTAQVTATTEKSGAYAIPQILDGVPLRIRTMNVTLNNPAFTFNPTSCVRSSITGTVYSIHGTATGVSAPFEANGCQDLPFKPGFSASTAARASKEDGASLVVKVASKGGPQTGEEANIRSVKVDLPKQLPSRLTTLQKACSEAQFDANPAGCRKESDIGTATAVTPILSHPLVGPAYLVSHGGAAFPDLEIILQGEGVELVLDGQTDIKNGITSSTFKTVPDAPISSFELALPAGPFSVLTANVPASAKYNLCGQTLNMPTAITGQNGAVIKQTTRIAITGCAKVKKKTLTRAQKLKKALKVCKKKTKGKKRAACERAARKKYGPLVKKTSKAAHRNGKGSK